MKIQRECSLFLCVQVKKLIVVWIHTRILIVWQSLSLWIPNARKTPKVCLAYINCGVVYISILFGYWHYKPLIIWKTKLKKQQPRVCSKMVKNCLIVFEMSGKISFLNQTEDLENLSFIKKPKILVVRERKFFFKSNPGQFLKSRFIGKKSSPSGGGTSRSNFPSLLVNGQDFPMECLSSWSAWSISSMDRTKICRLTLTKAKRVVVKWTFPSMSTGMFMRTSRLYDSKSGHLLPNPSGGSICFSRANISM